MYTYVYIPRFRSRPAFCSCPRNEPRATVPYMPRRKSGDLTLAGSTVVTFRVPNALLAQALTAAGGTKALLGEWARALFAAAVAGKAPGTGTLQAQGYEEGKRQGWTHANAVFREALREATSKL